MKNWLDYTALLFLGESNHGLYYKAKPPTRLSIDSDVVIKVLVRDSSDEQWQSVAQEIELLTQLTSPWIVKLIESGHEKGRLYYAMEYATIGTLARPARTLSLYEKIQALSHGVRGVALLHEKGIVHRDIKPATILVHEKGGRLNDLGVANQQKELGNAIPTGTIGFMAPEIAKGESATPASDIFSIGATLHLLLTGKSIFPGVPRDSLLEAVEHIATQVPIIKKNNETPMLMDIIDKCLKTPSASRILNALEIADNLDAALQKEITK